LVFVLAIDDAHLGEAVRSVYGQGFDAEGYLRRFIDWRFKLPEPSYEEFAKHLSKSMGLDGLLDKQSGYNSIDGLIPTFSFYAGMLNLSLREQEQVFTEINLAIRCYKESPLVPILCTAAILRLKMRDEFRAVVVGSMEVDRFLSILDERINAKYRESWKTGLCRHAELKMWLYNYSARVNTIDFLNSNSSNAEYERNIFIYNKIISDYFHMHSSDSPLKVAYDRLESFSNLLR
jgi:hypothetical protein